MPGVSELGETSTSAILPSAIVTVTSISAFIAGIDEVYVPSVRAAGAASSATACPSPMPNTEAPATAANMPPRTWRLESIGWSFVILRSMVNPFRLSGNTIGRIALRAPPAGQGTALRAPRKKVSGKRDAAYIAKRLVTRRASLTCIGGQ